MEIKAKAKHIKMSPKKVRLVVDIVRGLKVDEALNQLNFINKKATEPIRKLLRSAIANALNNFELEENNLYIKEIRVDDGPTIHRWMPKARGRATPIRKRTSHISMVLGELVESGEHKAKKQKIEAPIKLGKKVKEDDGVKVKSKSSTVKSNDKESDEDKGKKIFDPREQGKGKHTKIEGKSHEGLAKKIFRRKSG